MSDQATTSPARPALPARFSLDTWAVVAATAFVALIVVGVLPRVPW